MDQFHIELYIDTSLTGLNRNHHTLAEPCPSQKKKLTTETTEDSLTARYDPGDWTHGGLSSRKYRLKSVQKESHTNSNVMADKMGVEFSFHYALSQMESDVYLFHFCGEEFGRLSVKIHQANTCSLGTHFYKLFLCIQDRCVEISLGRRICARHRVRSRCAKKKKRKKKA